MFRYGLSPDGSTFTATRFDGFGDGDAADSPRTPAQRVAVVCDVETTGLSVLCEEVIEIGARRIVFDKDTGEVVCVGRAFQALQQPTKPLSSFIAELTGLTDEALAGKAISWDAFDEFIADAAVLVAHNCAFDRPFIDKCSKASRDKIWACSSFHLNWRDAFPSVSQPLLALFHGYFYDGHRALNDVDALIKLLSFPQDTASKTTYLYSLLQNAKKPCFRVYATNSPFETKDILKRRRYRWDNERRIWSKVIRADSVEQEKAFLTTEVYGGTGFLGRIEELSIRDNFRASWQY